MTMTLPYIIKKLAFTLNYSTVWDLNTEHFHTEREIYLDRVLNIFIRNDLQRANSSELN